MLKTYVRIRVLGSRMHGIVVWNAVCVLYTLYSVAVCIAHNDTNQFLWTQSSKNERQNLYNSEWKLLHRM